MEVEEEEEGMWPQPLQAGSPFKANDLPHTSHACPQFNSFKSSLLLLLARRFLLVNFLIHVPI